MTSRPATDPAPNDVRQPVPRDAGDKGFRGPGVLLSPPAIAMATVAALVALPYLARNLGFGRLAGNPFLVYTK